MLIFSFPSENCFVPSCKDQPGFKPYFVWSHPAPNHKIGFHILCFILLHCFQASWLWQLLHNLSGIFEIKKCFPRSVWEKFKSKARECLFIFESSSSLWQGQGDHEMIMLLLTFYGYCLKYGLICVGQRLFRNGLWPMLRAELEYDSDLDISLHLKIKTYFLQTRASPNLQNTTYRQTGGQSNM